MKLIDKVRDFRDQDKFDKKAWDERGLIPSDETTLDRMNVVIDNITEKILTALQKDRPEQVLEEILRKGIDRILYHEVFDTEETEFLDDLIFDLAKILNIQIGNEEPPGFQELIETSIHKCDSCASEMKTLIFQKAKQVNYAAWDIIKCNNCGELNLMSLDPYVKSCTPKGYTFVKQLNKDKYDEKSAELILIYMRNKISSRKSEKK